MKSLIALLLFSVALRAQQPPPQAAGYRLVFDDVFNSLDLSPARTAGAQASTWYQGIWYESTAAPIANITAKSGLNLTWTTGQTPADTAISTMSKDGKAYLSWQFGYFEVRMKWNPATGAWPAFWLTPPAETVPGIPETGEIDVIEAQGAGPQWFYGTVHDWVRNSAGKMVDTQNNGASNRWALPAGTDVSQYHTYGVLWTPTAITWYFDNAPLGSVVPYPILTQQPMMLNLAMQAGANWSAGSLAGVTASSMTLSVDYVRVWQSRTSGYQGR